MASTSSESEVDNVVKRLRDVMNENVEVSKELQLKSKELDIWKSIYGRDTSRLNFRIVELEHELTALKNEYFKLREEKNEASDACANHCNQFNETVEKLRVELTAARLELSVMHAISPLVEGDQN